MLGFRERPRFAHPSPSPPPVSIYRRGVLAAEDGPEVAADSEDDGGGHVLTAETRTQQVKKARAAELFEKLHASASGAAAGGSAKGATGAAGAGGSGGGGGGCSGSAKPSVDLAALCQPVQKQQPAKKKAGGGDEVRECGLDGGAVLHFWMTASCVP